MQRQPHGRTLALGCVAAVTLALAAGCDPLPEPDVTGALRARLEAPGTAAGSATPTVRPFYHQRGFAPVWTDLGGLTAAGESLVDTLCDADRHGPAVTSLPAIHDALQAMLAAPPGEIEARAGALAALEVELSEALLHVALDVWHGRPNLPRLEENWHHRVPRHAPDPAALLAGLAGSADVGKRLDELHENHPDYLELRAALERYRELAAGEGWPRVPAGPTLDRGARGDRVGAVRARLAATGDLPQGAGAPAAAVATYDEALARAVGRFQRRHGLEPTGTVDEATRSEMNVPPQQRVGRLEINLERQRWLAPQDDAERIVVNVPEFKLHAYRDGEHVLQMRVIVGKRMNQTPLFADEMAYVTFRPYWNVPLSIAAEEMLPQIAEDPSWLVSGGYEVVDPEGNILDAYRVHDVVVREDGARRRDGPPEFLPASNERGDPLRQPPDLAEGIAAETLRIRQRSGESNALGLVKFMFPNQFNVYLHDTPADHLFEHAARDFSHGCIRVEDPTRLAEYVLEVNGDWSRERIELKLHDPAVVSEEVPLERTIPVYIVYLTAWVDEEGLVNFRDDVYGHDARLRQVLDGDPLTPERQQTCSRIRHLTGGPGTPPNTEEEAGS